ncbi:MAG: zinc ribbon domain-containing protein [Chloroflexi bacterium]|nr:zinc ribbon domain-containing protein [Chloroflexota bacterium]
MPVYEYFCKSCDGVFETMRPIAQASDPAPCPVCAKKAHRIPPTSFSAFTMRDGYPRSIPDRGTYYHLEKEVKRPVTGSVRMNEHPEINKPRPKRKKSKGEIAAIEDRQSMMAKEQRKMLDSGIAPIAEPRYSFPTDDD